MPSDRDVVYTPDDLAHAIVRRMVDRRMLTEGDVVIEPSCGQGVFVDALHEVGMRVRSYDIDPGARGAPDHTTADWTARRWPRADAVVGNPPYGGPRPPFQAPGDPPYVGMAHVRHALDHAPVVAMLLPASWLTIAELHRSHWADIAPDEVWPVVGRPWRGLREAAVYVWTCEPRARPVIEWMEWRRS